SEIIFNGPYKSRDELEAALGEGALVNIDGFDELAAVTQVATGLGRAARVGIRVNFSQGLNPWTKFGFNYENGDAVRALERIAATPQLSLEALHNHGGTFVVEPKVYGYAASRLIDLTRRARALGLRPTLLDFGGGFPSGNRLKPQFDVPGGSVFEGKFLAPFAEAILRRVSRARHLFDGNATVVIEPGRALVDTAVLLACTVVATKEIPGQPPAVVVDAGVNVLPTAYWYDHAVEPAREPPDEASARLRPVNIYDPLCMQIDVLRERVLLPRLKVGSRLLFSHVGAYCMTQSMQFIQPRPAVVLLGPDGPSLVRRRETWQDVFALDHVPERLRRNGHAL
ncbi:MAG: diaminopimelate decarboxylase, partial [Nitrospinota bacterium]